MTSSTNGVPSLTHCGPVTQIYVFTLQLCKTGDANLRFYHALGFHALDEGWNFNSGNYLFTTDTK